MNDGAFDTWCLTATDARHIHADGRELPLLTVLLYRICDGDDARFQHAVEYMRQAYDAGRSETARVALTQQAQDLGMGY